MNLRPLVSPSSVVLAAAFLVLGLEAPTIAQQVAHKINGSSLKPNTVTGKQIKESSLGTVPKAKSLPAAKLHPLPLIGAWTANPDANEAPQYSVDAQGYVHLQGAVSSDGLGDDIFTLPKAARPAQQTWLPVIEGGGYFGALNIQPNGVATVADSLESSAGIAKVITYLDGLTFKAAS